MRVFDAHRLLGPIPTDSGADLELDLLAELDLLGIDGAAVTPTWGLFGDPRDVEHTGQPIRSDRLTTVPVVLPSLAGSGSDLGDAMIATAVMVRACPDRHRFDLLGPTALAEWRALSERGAMLAIDASECGIGAIHALAKAVPELNIFALTPGYRDLRRLVELMRAAPRVYVETGTMVAAGGVEWLARAVGAHRLIFGTGAPLWDDAGPRFQLEHLDLPDADVALIAVENWERLTESSAS